MVKGFIDFKDKKIPFVMENYRMELFSGDSVLDDFAKEYNFKNNYILRGKYFGIGSQEQSATFLEDTGCGIGDHKQQCAGIGVSAAGISGCDQPE